MSDDLVGRYRRVYPRIFRQPDFQKLTRSEQVIALYALAGPQTNRIGLFHFSIATAAEELRLGADTFREGLRNVTATFGWLFDADARVLYIPSWWRFNCPENANVLKGNLKDLSEIPPSGLIDAFATNTAYLPPDLLETFTQTLRKRLPKRSPTQEQEQEAGSGKQYQEPSALRAVRTQKKQKQQLREDPRNGTNSPLVAIAQQTIDVAGAHHDLDYLVDAFWITRGSSDGCSRAEAVAALNVALAQRRQQPA